MSPTQPDSSESAADLFADYLARREGDAGIDFDAFCAEYPEHASELHVLHEDLDRWEGVLDRLGVSAALSKHSGLVQTQTAHPASAEADPESDFSTSFLERLATRDRSADRFEHRGEIARGGMGRILDVWEPDLRRGLAMKVAMKGRARPGSMARFLEEAQITAQLDHPGVVPVHELGVDAKGEAFFTMARVAGRDLSEIFRLARQGSDGWNLTRAVGVLQRVCETMAYSHAKGVIHRDLKPANVMVGAFGETYVMDWGLAKVVGREMGEARTESPAVLAPVETDRTDAASDDPSSELLTVEGAVVGTPSFMSPEQAEGWIEALDGRSDVYSIGAMLYVLLTGTAPYVAEGASPAAAAVVLAIRERKPAPVHSLAKNVPDELVAICEKAMARDPGSRYATTMEMAEDLRAYLENRVVRAHRTGAWIEFRKWVARNKATAAALLGGLVVLLSGLGGVGYVEAKGRANVQVQLERVQRFSDSRTLKALLYTEQRLWPPLPELEDDLSGWLDDLTAVRARADEHRRTLDELSRNLARPSGADPEEVERSQRMLEEFLTDLEVVEGRRPGVEERHAFASAVRDRTIEGSEARERWATAIADAEQLEAYAGLALTPQLGLLPLRRDSQSGLWEFLHVQSGDEPELGAEGRWKITDRTGVVLVLLPGGEAGVGANYAKEGDDPREPYADPYRLPNYDVEEDLQFVRLDPFFMSKYEVTQGQWERVMESNPSQWKKPDHPIESVSYHDCVEALGRLVLELPTETQYEYACRGGTTTPFFTGVALESLAGFANVRDASYAGRFPGTDGCLSSDDGWPGHAPVGSYGPNPFGLHDVHGNVWSWCRDAYHDSGELREGDGLRLPAIDQVAGTIRGGSFHTYVDYVRSANRMGRGFARPNVDSDLGLRAVRQLER